MNDLDLLTKLKPLMFYDSRERQFAVVYGRLVKDYAQFWFWYSEDWSPLPWRSGHKPDIEMVQYRYTIGRDEHPLVTEAAYSQHSSGEVRDWMQLPPWPFGRPEVYVALGKHTPYFTSGWHWRGLWDVDLANAKKAIDPRLELAPTDGWVGAHIPTTIPTPARTLKWVNPELWAASLRH